MSRVNVGWAVIAALAAAASAAAASVLQYRSAQAELPGRGLHLRLLWRLVRRPAWLMGLLAALVSFGFHVLALSGGQLDVVQPVLVSGLLFALPASVLLDARRPSAVEWAWAFLLVVGLAVFLDAAQPSGGSGLPDQGRLILLAAAAGALGSLAVVLGRITFHRHRASLFGLATGLAYGLVAAFIKYSAALVAIAPVRLVSTWPVYVLVALGAVALVLNQAAYQAGSLAAMLPPLTIADPIVAVIIGAVAFGEELASTPLALTGELAGFLAMGVSVVQLARRSAGTMDRSCLPESQS